MKGGGIGKEIRFGRRWRRRGEVRERERGGWRSAREREREREEAGEKVISEIKHRSAKPSALSQSPSNHALMISSTCILLSHAYIM